MPTPETPVPSLAQVRAHINRLGGYARFAEVAGINQRTAERIFSGAMLPPHWLSDQMEALARFDAAAALGELKRRYPDDPAGNPCPDCGSFDHFECFGEDQANG